MVASIMNGDRHAATKLIRNTEKLVVQIVYKMIGNSGNRKDLIQDVYLKTFRNIPKFRFQCKLSTWVAQISYTTCLDHLQKMRPHLVENYGDENSDTGGLAEAQWIEGPRNPSQLLEAKERAAILENACTELPVIYNTLIILFHKQELSLEEIAEITSLPIGTIKNYLFRARKILKQRLLTNYTKEDI
ncbi:RNA polymerase sigma factor [Pedobacter steynii]